MALEDGWRDESFLAQVALVLLMAVVNHLDVHVQRVLALESSVALVALKSPLAWIREGKEGGEGGTDQIRRCT